MSGPATRRAVAAALVLLVLLLVAPGRTTHATWTDAAAVTGTTVVAGALEKPTLSCRESSPGGTNAARISWTASTSPTALTYTASIVEFGIGPLAVTDYVDVTPSLLSSLLGQVLTVRIVGALPGTSWRTEPADHAVVLGLLGAYVNCPS